jgi:hypothetical protein
MSRRRLKNIAQKILCFGARAFGPHGWETVIATSESFAHRDLARHAEASVRKKFDNTRVSSHGLLWHIDQEFLRTENSLTSMQDRGLGNARVTGVCACSSKK